MAVPRILVAALLLSVSCSSAPDSDAATSEVDYVVMFLKAGPVEDIAPGDLQVLLQGHLDNVRHLADAEELILAGPMVPPRADRDMRSFALFDTADVAHAEDLARTNPAVLANVFRYEAYPWRGPASLRRVNELERALREQLTPDAPPEATVVPYVLVTCADADAAERVLAPLRADGAVVFFGRLGGALDGHALFALAARGPEDARALLAETGPDAPEWALHPWFGPRVLLDLPR